MRYLIYSFQALPLLVLYAQVYYSNQSILETVSRNPLFPQNSLLRNLICFLLLLLSLKWTQIVCIFCLTLKESFDQKIPIHLHICNTSISLMSLHKVSCNILQISSKTILSLLSGYMKNRKQKWCCLIDTALWVLIQGDD